MSLLYFHPLFLTFSPKLRYPPRSRCTCYSAPAAILGNRQSSERENNGASVLWFKHDLRVDDHPGLAAAWLHRTVVPLYVFDRRILSRLSDEMMELVLFAIHDLRKSLKDQGSNLMIRFGSAEKVICEVVKEVQATNVFAEEEVEYSLRKMMDAVNESLATVSYPEGNPNILLWNTPFYDIKNLEDVPASYNGFKKLQFPVTSPLACPILTGVKMDLDWGPLPTFDDLKKFMNENECKSRERWILIKETSAGSILQKQASDLVESPNGRNNFNPNTRGNRVEKSVFVTREGNFVGGGTDVVLDALGAYLRYLEGTARDDWREVHEKLRKAETRNGASFKTLFGAALCLGIITRRRVYYEAIKYEKERNAGFLSPFGYSAATIAAATDAVCSMEWYWLMSLKTQLSDDRPYSIRIWRWNGHLIQYTVVGDEGPALLLVHGFGAFLDHYRDNIRGIASNRNRVWAVTLLGFGKSEKPNIVYTELMWAELLRDFIIEVVGEPVHLAGNSIGGYFVSIVAGLWPDLVKSIVLINSAGNVIPEYSSTSVSKERKTSGVAWLGARALLSFLRLSIRNIVKNCYPTVTERADDWLIDEMIRASNDPGVLVVLESIFSFDLSIPLNYLLQGFKGRVLIVQGMKDPISDSTSKLAMIREYCAGVVFREIDAGINKTKGEENQRTTIKTNHLQRRINERRKKLALLTVEHDRDAGNGSFLLISRVFSTQNPNYRV